MKKLFDKPVFLCYSISVENKKGVKNDRINKRTNLKKKSESY